MVYYFYIVVCILGTALVDNISPNYHQQSKKYFALLMGCIIFLLGALRHKYVGTDTLGYFEYLIPGAINQSYIQIFENSRDPIFYMFVKAIYQIINDIQFVLAVIALLYALFVSTTLYKYSKNIVLSFLILLTFRYFPFSMTALRQGLALAIVFYSTRFIFEKKFIKFILFIFIASLAHKSAIFLLPLYFVQFISLTRYSFIITFLALTAAYFLKNYINSILLLLPFDSQYDIYFDDKSTDGYGYLYYYLYIAVFIAINILLFYSDSSKLKRSKLSFYYYAFVIGIFFQTFAIQSPQFMRIGMYFAYYTVLLIPETISGFNDREEKIINFVLISLLIILFIIAGPGGGADNYYFFWEKHIHAPIYFKL